MEFVYIFRLLFRKKWIILGFALLAAIAAFLLTLRMKPQYKSSAQLSTGFTLSEDIKLADEGFNLSQIDVKFNNAIENITSPKVIGLLSYRLLLHDLNSNEPFRVPEKERITSSKELSSLNKDLVKKTLQNKIDSIKLLSTAVPLEKNIIDYLKVYGYHTSDIMKSLYVGRFQRTDYIDIVHRSENPELSAFVVNTLCQVFEYYFDTERRGRAIYALLSLDSITKKKKEELDRRVMLKTSYLNDSLKLGNQDDGVSKIAQLSQYENFLIEEQGRVQDLTYQIQYLEKQLEGAGASSSGNVPVRPNNSNTSNSQLLVLRRQYSEIFDQYTRGGSTDANLRQQLEDIQQKMRVLALNQSSGSGGLNDGQEGGNRSTLMQSKINAEGMLRSANTKIRFYQSKISELKGAISSSMPKATAKLEQLEKDIDIATVEYANAKERLNLAGNLEGSPSNFRQTLFGQPSIEPEPRRRVIIVGLAGASGFLLTSLVFLVMAYLDQSIRTPSQFVRLTGLKLLGTVNFTRFNRANIKDQVTHIESENRNNSFRELLRKLRFEIEGSGKQIILFTSTEPQQGKTTLVQAIAFSLSLGKKRVLVIDTNFCNNDVTALNNAVPNLETFDGPLSALNEEKVKEMVTPSGVPYVDILGCKGGDYTPSEILPENHLLKHLPHLLRFYDFIFMEGAPLNGFTDSKELSLYAEGVLAIFSATTELKQVDKESIQFLQKLGDKFMGAILNKVDEPDLKL